MENTILNKINSEQKSREAFGHFLGFNSANNDKKAQAKRWEDWGKIKRNDKGDELDKQHNDRAKKYGLAVAATVILGGASVLLGRKNFPRYRQMILDSYNDLVTKEGVQKHLNTADKIKKKVLGWLKSGMDFAFSGDKYKDNTVYRTLRGIPFIGPKIADFTRITSWVPKKLRLEGAWNRPEIVLEQNRPLIRQVLNQVGDDITPEGRKALEALSKGNPFTDVAQGLGQRIQKMKGVIDEYTKHINREYFPEGNLFRGEIGKMGRGLVNGSKSIIAKAKKGEDFVMSEWSKEGGAAAALYKKVDDTADIGKTMDAVEQLIKNRPKNMSDEAVKALEAIKDAYYNARKIEVDVYGGRVRDLALGAGVTEMFVPLIAGGLLAKSTMNGKDKEEKIDKFVKNGGIGIVGGLGVWIGTMAMAVNGPMLIPLTIATGVGIDMAGRVIYNQIKKKKQNNK